ncbi:MAG: cell division protein FtsH, partial [Gordonia paraffinivorans]
DGLAKRTPGMSGADLSNVINEAALLTARENKQTISAESLEEAVDRVIGGPRRKSRIISEHEKKVVAYHEGGHTLAAWAMPDLDPIYKVTILARGRTGGHALAVPEQDKDLMTRSEMIARLVMAMGGRAAEELVFHEPTTGASSDIDQATKIARAMVTEYGMSAKLGAVRYGQEQGDPFLGRSMGTHSDYSAEVASEIDDEVRRLIEAAHTEAWAILSEYRDTLDELATQLLERETLTRKDLEAIFSGVEKRPRITTFNDFGDRTPSDKPPVKTPKELATERGEPWPPEPAPDLRKEPVGAPGGYGQGQNGHGPDGTNGYGPNGHGQNGYGPNGHGQNGHGAGGYGPQGQNGHGQGPSGGYGPNGGYGQGGYGQGGPSYGQPTPPGRGDDYPGYPQGYPAPGYGGPGYGNPGHQPTPQPVPRDQDPSGANRPSGPDYGAPEGWSAPGWPPRDGDQRPPNGTPPSRY